LFTLRAEIELFFMNTGDTELRTRKTVAYVRTSTEHHQQYSTGKQMEVVREYAKRHGLEIVEVYSDEGKSDSPMQVSDSSNSAPPN
jgi:hypothetical protein